MIVISRMIIKMVTLMMMIVMIQILMIKILRVIFLFVMIIDQVFSASQCRCSCPHTANAAKFSCTLDRYHSFLGLGTWYLVS